MKVLFVSSWYPTPQNPNLGIFIKEHAKSIKTADHDIRVLALVVVRDEPYFKVNHREYIDESGIRTFEIVIKSRIRDVLYHLVPLQNIIAYRYYKKYIARYFVPDIIHSNVVFPAGIIGDYIARKLKKPHVITEHWSKLSGLLEKPFLSRLAIGAYKRSKAILPVSKFLEGNIVSLIPSLREHRFHVVPNVISPEVFSYREKIPVDGTIRFCAVATWATKKVPDKQPELFIEALAKLQNRIDKKIELTMVGNGNRVPELKALCQSLSLNVDFVGYKTKPQIAEILYKSDFFLHASKVETFGVVVVEALMTGTPVICSAVGGLPELIDDSNGVLCENTVDDWEEAVTKSIRKLFVSRFISDNIVDNYSYNRIGGVINRIYRSINKKDHIYFDS